MQEMSWKPRIIEEQLQLDLIYVSKVAYWAAESCVVVGSWGAGLVIRDLTQGRQSGAFIRLDGGASPADEQVGLLVFVLSEAASDTFCSSFPPRSPEGRSRALCCVPAEGKQVQDGGGWFPSLVDDGLKCLGESIKSKARSRLAGGAGYIKFREENAKARAPRLSSDVLGMYCGT